MTRADTTGRRTRSPRGRRTLRRQPAVVVSVAILAFIAVSVVVGPWIIGDGTDIDATSRMLAPGLTHPFGTDELGRDLLARNLIAGRLTILIATGAAVLSVLLGVAWGLVAAESRGWLDEVLMRFADAILAIPMILFGLVAVAAFGSSVVTLIVILGILKTPLTARVVRAATLSELTTDYVRGLTAVGVPRMRIVFREVLPNVVPTIIAQATLNIATAIIVEASLSFMGLGIQPPQATWGTLTKSGYNVLFQSPTYVLFPAILTLAFVASLNVLGQRLQQALDGRSA